MHGILEEPLDRVCRVIKMRLPHRKIRHPPRMAADAVKNAVSADVGVQRCNNIHNRAEEIILQEMIYS